jgi:hypothetical protein
MRERYANSAAETLSAARRGSRAVLTEDVIDLSHSRHIPTTPVRCSSKNEGGRETNVADRHAFSQSKKQRASP